MTKTRLARLPRTSGKINYTPRLSSLSNESWRELRRHVMVERGNGAGSRTIECGLWLILYLLSGTEKYLLKFRELVQQIEPDSEKRQQMDERLRCAALTGETK
jgi:hypothetical protein